MRYASLRNDLHGVGCYDSVFAFSGTIGGKIYTWSSIPMSYLDRPSGEMVMVDHKLLGGIASRFDRRECVLVTELNDKRTFGKAVRYVLDAEEQKCLDDWMKSCGCAFQGSAVNYSIVFKDAEGEEVGVFQWPVSKSTLSNVGTVVRYENEPGVVMRKEIAVYYVSPQVGCAGAKFLTWRDFVFDQDDLARIKSVSIELAE